MFSVSMGMVFVPQASLVALKGDIDSAYSRIPLDPTHREFAYIVFSAEGSVQIFRHNSCPFGAIGAVHGWDRPGTPITWCHCREPLCFIDRSTGNLLCAILRRVLKLPLLRYVDDLHGVERSQSVQHAEEIMARCLAPHGSCSRALPVFCLSLWLQGNQVPPRPYCHQPA